MSYLCRCVSVHSNFTKYRQGRAAYVFHGNGELCNFIYRLLLKSRDVSALPAMHEEEEYMDVKKMVSFPSVDMPSLLSNHDFGKELAVGKVSDVKEVLARCKDFIDRFVFLFVEKTCAISGISRNLFSFGPEIMQEGDNSAVFSLFSDLCVVLTKCGVVSADEGKAAVEDYNSYVMEKPRQQVG